MPPDHRAYPAVRNYAHEDDWQVHALISGPVLELLPPNTEDGLEQYIHGICFHVYDEVVESY